MRDLTFRRERLRRPEIRLSINEIKRDSWSMFAQHHYLSSALSRTSHNYGCVYDNQLVGCAAGMPAMGHKDVRRVHRIVILPDFQGCGIGSAFLNGLGKIYGQKKLRLTITSSHPGIVRGLERNRNWRLSNFWRHGTRPQSGYEKNRTTRVMIPLVSFEYRGE